MAVATYLLALIAAVTFSALGLIVVAIICGTIGAMLMFRYELAWVHSALKAARHKPHAGRP